MRKVKDALAELVRSARRERNLTQEGLAESLKLGLRTITDIEMGRGNPKLDTLVALQRFLSFSTDTIIFGDNFLNKSECSALFKQVAVLPDGQRHMIEEIIKTMLKEFTKGNGLIDDNVE